MALFAGCVAEANSGGAPPGANPNATQIVAEMQRHNDIRDEELKQYQSLRVYRVEYHGYATKISARMEVEVKYDSSSGKKFRIVSESGPRFLVDRVLKRAVESEEQASQDKRSTALTPENYRFQLVGSETLQGRPAYVLEVEPLKPSKFLYQGKIWVDEADFAVVQVKAAPSKSPSFWIDRTAIEYTNAMTGGFWLPEQIRSQTWVRIGGRATLTIDYGTYQVVPADAEQADAPQSAPN